MLIVNQKQDSIVNFDNVLYVDLNNCKSSFEVTAVLTNGVPLTIGTYKNVSVAESAMEGIQATYLKSCIILKSSNCPTRNTVIYNMPADNEN